MQGSRVVAVSGTTWQRLVLGFSGRARPHAIKTSHVLRGRGTAPPLPSAQVQRPAGITGSLWPPHRAQDLAWAAGMAHGGTARRGGSCFQRLSPYPVALSCALQLAWASCPKSRFLFFALFFNTKTDCIVSCIWSSVVCTVACYCTSLNFFSSCSTTLLKRMIFFYLDSCLTMHFLSFALINQMKTKEIMPT